MLTGAMMLIYPVLMIGMELVVKVAVMAVAVGGVTRVVISLAETRTSDLFLSIV